MNKQNEQDLRFMLDATENVTIGPLNTEFLAKPISILEPKEPILVKEDTLIKDIIPLFQTHKCEAVFVTNIDEKLVGIYTERDLVLKSLKDKDFENNEVSLYMTKDVLSGKMDHTIAYVLNILSDGGFKQFPIIDDNGYPIAHITLRNILDYIVKESIKPLLDVSIPKVNN
ncbi:MAG: CBS domain-containing protein [Bdellovibrionota bacterium]|nr:CBS domain-containing protein [Pseudomonadota bacterium]MDY6091071.1 CBS domain-containing protein [Bdellovibrionota bacterium]